MKYAVIDIEGTGGNTERSRIMEIAVYVYDDKTGEIIDEFSTLVNPGKKPDDYVIKMTGITQKMLKKAPKFHEIAKRIVEMTEDAVLTAHNAGYDYAMLRQEFKRLGYTFERPLLDTVHLSEVLLPGIKSPGLDNLVKQLKIPAPDRHRAFGDAKATVEILKILLQKDPAGKKISQLIHYPSPKKNTRVKRRKEYKILQKLPHKPGILKFIDEEGKILYVIYTSDLRLKAENILSKSSNKFIRLRQKTADITGKVLYSKVIGKIETQKIRKELRPPFSPYIFNEHPVHLPEKTILLFDIGRNPYEKSVILIEKGKLSGYTFADLNWQSAYSKKLKKRLTPLHDCPYGRYIIDRKLKKNYFSKIQIIDDTQTGTH